MDLYSLACQITNLCAYFNLVSEKFEPSSRWPRAIRLDFFLDNSLSDYSKNEIVRDLGMGRATFFKYWKELEKSGAVKVTRSVGRATMYQLARGNEVVKQLVRLDMALARGAMDKSVKEYEKPLAVRSR